ncbi:MAG: MBL fold metallo-hydrolase [Phycisphaerales bacterium]|nr:MBL fold metallo-hydrolase [Phycisphaerales bacterium]
MRLRFLGAAGEVTGSCQLVETDRARVLVDFGLHQGGPTAERRNRRFPPIRPADLDSVVLTHAHIDHSGRLPLLPRHGFSGPIFATPATIDLCDVMLRDSAGVQAMDAERWTRRHEREGKPGEAPLYGVADVEAVMKRFRALPYDTPREVAAGVTVRFTDAGHILGSASVEMRVRDGGREKVVVFSGDVGPAGAPLLRDPVPPGRADALVLESTYGDRDHRPLDATLDELVGIVREARTPRGKVLIPAFAVGRTQQLIYFFGTLRRDGRLDDPRVWVDSPMALAATDLYRRHRDLFDDESWKIIDAGDSVLMFPGLRFARSIDESIALNRTGDGVVVISASGMCNGGRILHHLRHALWKPETHLVFVGFQAEGTIGRRIIDGAEYVSIMGERIKVGARVHTLGGFSAHAGQTGLVRWAGAVVGRGDGGGTWTTGGVGGAGVGANDRPRVFLNHGEDKPRRLLAERLRADLGVEAELPAFGEIVEV